MATTNRLPRKIGPRLVQGASPVTSDALTAVGSVVVVAETGGPASGGGGLGPVIMGGDKNGGI